MFVHVDDVRPGRIESRKKSRQRRSCTWTAHARCRHAKITQHAPSADRRHSVVAVPPKPLCGIEHDAVFDPGSRMDRVGHAVAHNVFLRVGFVVGLPLPSCDRAGFRASLRDNLLATEASMCLPRGLSPLCHPYLHVFIVDAHERFFRCRHDSPRFPILILQAQETLRSYPATSIHRALLRHEASSLPMRRSDSPRP